MDVLHQTFTLHQNHILTPVQLHVPPMPSHHSLWAEGCSLLAAGGGEELKFLLVTRSTGSSPPLLHITIRRFNHLIPALLLIGRLKCGACRWTGRRSPGTPP